MDEKKEEIFYAISMHGMELDKKYIIPHGIRIIMFCYSGQELDVSIKFNDFMWDTFFDKNAYKNYYTFLTTIAGYSSIRNHFCVYKEGERIRDIELHNDKSFRDGIYQLPVKIGVFDPKHDVIYLSDNDILAEATKLFGGVNNKYKRKFRLIVDNENAIFLASVKQYKVHMFSRYGQADKIMLSDLITHMQKKHPSFTVILFTCRDGKNDKTITRTNTVKKEIEKIKNL